jgi:valyl-tRNA synthetase
MNAIRPDASFDPSRASLPLTRWILDAMNRAVEQASAALEDYRFDEYAAACYRFTWDTFCDWFVEFAKPALAEGDSAGATEVRATAAYVLGSILRLLHPAMPFVTEELWDHFGFGAPCSLIRAAWPEPVAVLDAADAHDELDWVVRLISEVRSVRTEMNVPPATLTPIWLRDASPETLARGQRWMEAIRRLARASELKPLAGEMPAGSAQLTLDEVTVILPLTGVIDIAAERMRLSKERDRTAGEARKIAQKLNNGDFVRRAPEEVVEENRERLAATQAEIVRLEAALLRIA